MGHRRLSCAVVTTALLAGLAAPSSAQRQPSAYDAKAPQLWSYDAARGTLARRSAPAGVARGLQECYSNSTSANTFLAPLQGEELVDWGTKGCGLTGLVDRFVFAYATAAVDTSLGGPGAAITLALYAGGSGPGDPGTELVRAPLTGLPAGDGSGFFGPFIIEVTGLGPLCIGDGAVAWGYADNENGAGLTGPILVQAGQNNTGTLDLLDSYAAPARGTSYQGAFSLNTAGIASTYMVLGEADGASSSAVRVLGSGTNPNIWSPGPPILGRTWDSAFDLSAFPGVALTGVAIGSGPLQFQMPLGELLVAPPALVPVDLQPSGGLHSLPMPKDPLFIGATFHAQGFLFTPGQGFTLTNGGEMTFGL